MHDVKQGQFILSAMTLSIIFRYQARKISVSCSRRSDVIVISSHIISYHIVDLKRQNRLKVGTNKPKMQSVSDDDVRKRPLDVVIINYYQQFVISECCFLPLDGVVLNPRQYRVAGCDQSVRNGCTQRQKPNPPPPPIRRSSSLRGQSRQLILDFFCLPLQ